jgi:hypothetical protein
MYICVRYKWTRQKRCAKSQRRYLKKKSVGAWSVAVFIDDHCEKSKLSVVSAGLHNMKQMRYVEVNNSVITEDWQSHLPSSLM